jgi:hypothetical protein
VVGVAVCEYVLGYTIYISRVVSYGVLVLLLRCGVGHRLLGVEERIESYL